MTAIVLNQVDPKKRRFLIAASSVVGAGAAAAVAVPFVASMLPSARAVAAGAPVPVDLTKIEPGQLLTIEFRGAPHWVIKRTPEMVLQLSKNDALLPIQSRTLPNSLTTQKIPAAPSSRKYLLPAVCAPIWDVRQRSAKKLALPIWVRTGRVVFSVLVINPSSTCQAACLRACQRRPIWLSRPINLFLTRRC